MRCIALVVTLIIGTGISLFTEQRASPSSEITHDTFSTPDGAEMTYAISLPTTTSTDSGAIDPLPLILALHPGGARTPYYGSSFMQSIVEPAFRSWNAIIIAPDAPTRSWATDESDRAVIALIRQVMTQHAVDPERVLVTGFSLGGRGTWFFATRHADLFTGAIPMAGPVDEGVLDAIGTMQLDRLAAMPIHIVHSRDDERVAFQPAAEAAERLKEQGNPVELTALSGIGHFAMGAYISSLRIAGDWMMEQWENR
tara:strand:+ start:12240 stop:13004 length:765 start_codon:yes stop_codon:yes gene_type:complete